MEVRIGITTSFNEGEQRLNHEYVRAVELAGGVPMIVPMVDGPEVLRSFVDLLDGLLVTGGPAITQGLIGDLPEDINETDPVRLRSDAAVVDVFLKAKRPILGICYGMQMLNAVHGGTIYADIEKSLSGVHAHSEKRGGDHHPIEIVETSHLFDVLKKPSVDVNTRHIQAVADVADSFRIAARSADGVVEAIENEEGTILGVQFHPEKMGDEMLPLFRHLVENARRVALARKDGT